MGMKTNAELRHINRLQILNRLFTLGAPHNQGEGPDPEEIFTAFPINERKVSFKSGYGKYLKIEKDGMVTGRSEAVGSMEQWEPVFEVRRHIILASKPI